MKSRDNGGNAAGNKRDEVKSMLEQEVAKLHWMDFGELVGYGFDDEPLRQAIGDKLKRSKSS